MEEDTYLHDRIDGQIAWFSKKSMQLQARYKRRRKLQGACLVLVPIVSMAPFDGARIMTAALGAVASYLQFLGNLDHDRDLWRRYRLACESLKQEKLLYLARAGAYKDSEERFPLLVERAENILQSANADWHDITKELPHSSTSS